MHTKQQLTTTDDITQTVSPHLQRRLPCRYLVKTLSRKLQIIPVNYEHQWLTNFISINRMQYSSLHSSVCAEDVDTLLLLRMLQAFMCGFGAGILASSTQTQSFYLLKLETVKCMVVKTEPWKNCTMYTTTNTDNTGCQRVASHLTLILNFWHSLLRLDKNHNIIYCYHESKQRHRAINE